MPKVLELRCRECERSYAVAPIYVCEFCFAPLEPVYDYDRIAASIDRERIAAGPLSVWRYADLLPVEDSAERVDLGAGFTPLLKAQHLGAEFGIRNLYLKNDKIGRAHV